MTIPGAMRLLLPAVSALIVLGCAGEPSPGASSRPSLVVLVVVDQLRSDLLERYAPAFTGGLARMAREGVVFPEASHRHAATNTAVGHTTLSTGVVPARHGIVGNDWWETAEDGEWVSVYSVEDTLSPIVGHPEEEGRSPRNLERDGLADWILTHDPDARVVSVAKKDRAAIPLAGRTRGHVYWIHEGTGAFVTSTWYRDDLPGWVSRFNRERMPELLGDPVWTSSTPDSLMGLARRDPYPYEGDGVHTAFPHLREEERPGPLPEAQYRWAVRTPAPDRAVFELASVAVRELGLGGRPSGTDYLALGFSQTDHVGHAYGPGSQEQLTNLRHLDEVLEDLFELLDRSVGPGRWVVGFSSDHGVMDIPEWSQELGLDSRRLEPEEIRSLRAVADSAAGAAREEGSDVQGAVARAVESIPWVRKVYLPDEIARERTDSFAALFARSHSVTRRTGSLARYGLYLQLESGILHRTDRQGTGHGSPYWHDRHVPYVVYGAGLRSRTSGEPVYTYQMAPTLAHLAGVPVPPDLDGEPAPVASGGIP